MLRLKYFNINNLFCHYEPFAEAAFALLINGN